MADAAEAAGEIANRQAVAIARALTQVAAGMGGPPEAVVLAGHGDQLGERAVERAGMRPRLERLAEALGPSVARVAPAHALALLARGRLG